MTNLFVITGTAGFILEEWEPGVTAITRRNPNSWKADRVSFDKVETLSINDVNARTNALKTGQIQFMDRCERKTVHLLKRSKGIAVNAVTATFHYTMPMHTKMNPYDDNNVRLGLKHTIDRDELVKRILNGYGEAGTLIPIFAQIVEGLSDRIGHDTISGHMKADGQRNAEHWWFK